jgi:hypothetical protein
MKKKNTRDIKTNTQKNKERKQKKTMQTGQKKEVNKRVRKKW